MQSNPDQTIGQTHQDQRVSRRRFLRFGVTAAAAGVTGAALGATVPEIVSPPPTELQRLQSLNLADYYGILLKYRLLRNTFQAAPNFADSNIWSLEKALEQAAQGKLITSENEIDVLSQKIGTEKDQAVTKAHEIVDSLEVEGHDPQEVKAALHTLANVMPIALIAMTPNNKITISGDQGGSGNSATMSLPSPTDRQKFFVSALHEFSHRLEANWMRYAQYVDKNKLINYWETTLDNVYRLAKTFFTLPWDEAKHFKRGSMLMISCPNDFDLDRTEKRLSMYAPNPYNPGEMPQEHDIDDNSRRSYRFNKLSHHYGKLLLDWNSKAKLSEEEDRLRYDIGLAKMKSSVIGEIYHFFTGPVQKEKGGLPPTDTEIGDISSPINLSNLQVQQARLAAFSTLPFGAGVDKLYTALDLDQPTLIDNFNK
ncbi:hypothetical protein HY407_02700 [Candidatus Gottesmanbacteria bacterium]|nr:hypothetical protein [Candidatus Gottesmanbacteria bacterium]